MTELTKDLTIKSIFNLLHQKRIFAQCPKCLNYLSLFEVYNENCAKCGKIDFNKITLIDFYSIDD